MKELLVILHPTTGGLAMLCAMWMMIESLNANEKNSSKIVLAAKSTASLMWLTAVFGGFWYIVFYSTKTALIPEQAIIQNGPWPFGHSLIMESKELIFIMLLMLASTLPIIAKEKITQNSLARKLSICMSGLTVALCLWIEGSGALIALSAKVAYMGLSGISS